MILALGQNNFVLCSENVAKSKKIRFSTKNAVFAVCFRKLQRPITQAARMFSSRLVIMTFLPSSPHSVCLTVIPYVWPLQTHLLGPLLLARETGPGPVPFPEGS